MFLLTSLQHNILLHIKQHIFHPKINSRKNNNKKLEAKPPKFTLYKYHISLQGQIRAIRQEADECRSFISIIFPCKGWKRVFNQGLCVSILYKYHIFPDALQEAYENGRISCQSFISIIFPWRKSVHVGHLGSWVSILYKYHISLKEKCSCRTSGFVSVNPL